tara:strand:+ start:988 stop:1311 length:324 start_codon:yes stop_codon:yes gene_type:complete
MTQKEKFIRDRQADFPEIEKMQEWIDLGYVWSMEGSVGREAMRGLDCGMYFLPNQSFRNPYGQHIPSREEIRIGTEGSLDNAYDFYNDDQNLWDLELEYNAYEDDQW